MPAKTKGVKLVVKHYSIHPIIHQEIIDHFIEAKGATSDSDVVRQALVFYHEKTFPDYVYKKTTAMLEKERKADEEAAFRAMPDEVYAADVMKAPIFRSTTGENYVLVHTIGNSVIPFLLAGIKEKIVSQPEILNTHLRILRERPIEDALTEYMKSILRQKYNLVI